MVNYSSSVANIQSLYIPNHSKAKVQMTEAPEKSDSMKITY